MKWALVFAGFEELINSRVVISAARDLRKKQLILGREGFEKEDRLPWERECFCG